MKNAPAGMATVQTSSDNNTRNEREVDAFIFACCRLCLTTERCQDFFWPLSEFVCRSARPKSASSLPATPTVERQTKEAGPEQGGAKQFAPRLTTANWKNRLGVSLCNPARRRQNPHHLSFMNAHF